MDNPHSSDQGQFPDWFAGTPDNTSLSVAAEVTPKPPRKQIKKPLIIALISILIVVIAITIVIMTHRTNCLTPEDYASLTQTEDYHDDSAFDPKVEFYSEYFTFSAGSSDYEPDTVASSASTIESFGAFYTAHSNKPMRVTLTTSYDTSSPDNNTLAKLRLEKIARDLASAGIPSSAIVQDTQGLSIISDDELRDYLDTVTLSLTSLESCK